MRPGIHVNGTKWLLAVCAFAAAAAAGSRQGQRDVCGSCFCLPAALHCGVRRARASTHSRVIRHPVRVRAFLNRRGHVTVRGFKSQNLVSKWICIFINLSFSKKNFNTCCLF
jgi:hypothetical protein